MEMKHNSAIKQLMREFNTQMALKEAELDSAVKEVIGEAMNEIIFLCCGEITAGSQISAQNTGSAKGNTK